MLSSMLAAGLNPTSQIQLNLTGKRHKQVRATYASYIAASDAARMSPAGVWPPEDKLEDLRLGVSDSGLAKTATPRVQRGASAGAGALGPSWSSRQSGQPALPTQPAHTELPGAASLRPRDARRRSSNGELRSSGAVGALEAARSGGSSHSSHASQRLGGAMRSDDIQRALLERSAALDARAAREAHPTPQDDTLPSLRPQLDGGADAGLYALEGVAPQGYVVPGLDATS